MRARLERSSQTHDFFVVNFFEVLFSCVVGSMCESGPATRLTEQRRCEAKGQPLNLIAPPEMPQRICCTCGAAMPVGDTHCTACWAKSASERMLPIAAKGRILARTPAAQARRAATRRRQMEAERAWKPEEQPAWLTEGVYREEIRPRLEQFSAARLASTLEVSAPYAVDIRAGRCCPHPRHWLALAILVGISAARGSNRGRRNNTTGPNNRTAAAPAGATILAACSCNR